MDSDSDSSSDTELSEAFQDSEEEETGVITSQFRPYEDEPLADPDENMEDDSDDDLDVDGLTPAVLEARYDGTVEVRSWCTCDQCSTATLIRSMEYRCCREVVHAVAKLTFDGSIERVKCITQHEDYTALINRTVLLQVGPLLKDREGKRYRRRAGVSENE